MSHDNTSRRVFGVQLETLVRRILKTFDAATPADVEAGSRWYSEAGKVAANLAWLGRETQDRDDFTVEHAAAIIAHHSPRTAWDLNVMHATTFVLTGGCAAAGTMSANVERAMLAWLSSDPIGTLNGPKTRRFALNILGDVESVTVDVWACRVAGIDADKHLSRKGAYDAVEHAYRLAARRRGVDPSTMQAVTWIVARGGRAD